MLVYDYYICLFVCGLVIVGCCGWVVLFGLNWCDLMVGLVVVCRGFVFVFLGCYFFWVGGWFAFGLMFCFCFVRVLWVLCWVCFLVVCLFCLCV